MRVWIGRRQKKRCRILMQRLLAVLVSYWLRPEASTAVCTRFIVCWLRQCRHLRLQVEDLQYLQKVLKVEVLQCRHKPVSLIRVARETVTKSFSSGLIVIPDYLSSTLSVLISRSSHQCRLRSSHQCRFLLVDRPR